ncbi:hypothetical protein [Oscillospiraceae bacterium]|nr:hypothetical protein [Oscillospiraceae bacterium]
MYPDGQRTKINYIAILTQYIVFVNSNILYIDFWIFFKFSFLFAEVLSSQPIYRMYRIIW